MLLSVVIHLKTKYKVRQKQRMNNELKLIHNLCCEDFFLLKKYNRPISITQESSYFLR